MTKKPETDDTDKAAFKEAMKGVKRLIQKKRHIAQSSVKAIKRSQKSSLENENSDFFQFSDYEIHESVSYNTLIEFFRPGIQPKVIRNMRTGRYDIEAKLDLHGLIVVEAREALAQFLAECQLRKIRQVLIIHGKGRANQDPILKNKLNHWLRQTSDILAFCSAKSKEGGTGAVYVLLKLKN